MRGGLFLLASRHGKRRAHAEGASCNPFAHGTLVNSLTDLRVRSCTRRRTVPNAAHPLAASQHY